MIAAAALAGLTAAPAQAQRLPTLFTGQYAHEPDFAVRPAVVAYTGDATGFLGGAREPGHRFGSLRWKRWSGERARAKGLVWLNDCRPNCADGRFHGYRASVTATHPRHHRFTRLKIKFARHGHHRTDVRRLQKTGGTFAWLELRKR